MHEVKHLLNIIVCEVSAITLKATAYKIEATNLYFVWLCLNLNQKKKLKHPEILVIEYINAYFLKNMTTPILLLWDCRRSCKTPT